MFLDKVQSKTALSVEFGQCIERMDDYRKDSLYLDFSVMPVRPKLDKVYELISQGIKLDMTKINCIQPSMSKARVIIECKSQTYVEELVAEHSSKHNIEHNNKQYAIPLVPYDNAIEVRVADLPSYVPSETVSKHLAQYGEVISLQEEVWKNFWPGLPTGVRIVRMRIQKPIPSYIPMTTHTAYITYRNQIRTCRYCVRPLHIGRSCNEARKELGIDINSRLTAAQVVQGNIPALSTSAMEIEMSENENNSSKTVSATTDRVMQQMTRSSSSTRVPTGNSQNAGSSSISSSCNTKGSTPHTLSQPQVKEFDISDDAEAAATAKRQRSPLISETHEAPFQEIKRKSRSRTKHQSSSR